MSPVTLLKPSKLSYNGLTCVSDSPRAVLALSAEPSLEDIEGLNFKGKGSKRGKSKEGEAKDAKPASVAPEVEFYSGPPAISETFIPTLSILTVVGIIPAAASWSRQAWVRYTISSRRLRVQSGFGGKDMAEIVWPDVVEIRSVKRLLGDGDFVFFLKDGAKFEVRNVPQYEDARKFILEQCDEDVRNEYNKKGEVN